MTDSYGSGLDALGRLVGVFVVAWPMNDTTLADEMLQITAASLTKAKA